MNRIKIQAEKKKTEKLFKIISHIVILLALIVAFIGGTNLDTILAVQAFMFYYIIQRDD